MSLRQRDVEQWMSHRRLAEDLRRYHIIPFLYNMFVGENAKKKQSITPYNHL